MAAAVFKKKNLEAPPEDARQKGDAKDSEPPVHDESNWLVSYADMMTLLCGFFIMLFSMANLEKPQYEGFKEAMAKQFGGEYKSESRETAIFMTQVLSEMGAKEKAVIKSDYSGVTIVFQSTVFFETLSAEVKPEGREILSKMIQAVQTREEMMNKKYKIIVEGHTDSRPILGGIFPSNWELSSARASRVVRLFLDKGFLPINLIAIGYADTRPEILERKPSGELDEGALSKNRRVVLRILDPRIDAIPFPENAKNLTAGSQEAVPVSAPAALPPAK